MRKYLQISFFMGLFAILVVVRQLKADESQPVIGGKSNSQIPSNASPTLTPTQSNPNSSTHGNMMSTPMPMMGMYKNGTYTGSVEDAFYGNIQVQAKISNGRLSDVIFLQFPNDNRTSTFINSQADPMLAQEAIQAQSANVDIISGASASSQAFQASLANALSQAKN